MFRNAEYVIALKQLMHLQGAVSLQEYNEAFRRLDEDNSGYIEIKEVETLLNSVYKDRSVPEFEVSTFMKFFDKNRDGKISWEEFEQGLGTVLVQRVPGNLLPASVDVEDDEDENDISLEPQVTGTIEIEFDDGKVVEVDAKEYVQNLKNEARILKETLQKQTTAESGSKLASYKNGLSEGAADDFGSITAYITNRQGDVKALTEGISPDIIETMKMLVDHVLEGGGKSSSSLREENKNNSIPKEQMQLEIPGSALQQLALWQLVLGYRLRESEAKGDYLRLVE
jgi:EF-hand domain pair/Protein of unknown function (DUF760)